MERGVRELGINDDDSDSGSDGSDGPSISVVERAALAMEKHKKKISDVENKLKSLKQRKNMHVDEVPEHLQLLEVEESRLKELLGQKYEFKKYSNNILSNLNNLRSDASFFLENEFALECKRFESALPIYSKKSDILNMISKHQVTIITAETGSGKSTQIVQYLHQEYGNQMIVCTQPRKVAAISLAKRVSEELESQVGRTVGYRVGTSSMMTDDTLIFFVTDHLLLNECLDDPLLRRYKYIIIDEAHERSIPTDLLIAMVKKALDVRRELRLIISSATIDPKVFKDYFKEKAVCLHVHGRIFPVQVIHEDVSICNSYGNNYLQEAIRKTKYIHETEKEGDILVFLTTPGETEKAQEMVETDKNLKDKIQCLILHGRLLPEEQQRVFDPTPLGKRKVVFATNSAETSITIPNIRYVIDSGMVKEKHYDKERNISLLRVGYVNKSSAIQRQGRAGRTQEGKCFRLYTEEEYKAMADEMLPEILRENLGIALLKLYQFGIHDPLNYDFVQPPLAESLRWAQKELFELGALQDNKLTRYGKIMATLGVEPKIAKFVALAIDDDIPIDAMVVAAVCSIGSSVFFRAGTEDDKQAADRLKVRFCKKHGDLITMLEVFKEWNDEDHKNAWCFDNSLNSKTLRYTKELVLEMKRNVGQLLGRDLDNSFMELDEVLRKLPILLSKCFKNNIAYFSGHARGGYYIPNRGKKERFHLHPSAALSYLNMTPKWLLFTEVLCTSRTYIINTSVLPDHIGEAMFGRIVVPQILPRKEWIVGKETARNLGLGRWESSQEQEMQENINENIYIGFDSNIGKVTLYSEVEHTNKAINVLDKAIEKQKRDFDRKIYDEALSDGNPTSVVLKKGGVCSEILEHGQFNSVLIRKLSKDVSEETVEEFFGKYGSISEVIKFKGDGHDTWGKVTYQSSTNAVSAINFRGYGQFAHIVVKPAHRNETKSRTLNYAVKACWTRRPAKGDYAFLTFDDYNTASSEFIGRTKKVGNSFYSFQKAKKENDVMMKGIKKKYISTDEIILGIENEYPHVKIIKCIILRVEKRIEPPDTLRAIKSQLSLKVGRMLGQAYQRDRGFFIRLKPIHSDKAYDYEATIHFKNLKDAITISKGIVLMGEATVRLELEKKTPAVSVSKEVHSFVKNDLGRSIKAIQNVKINASEKKPNNKRAKPSKEIEIELESKDMESLSKARTVLYDFVFGTPIKFTEEQFRYFMSPNGKTFIETLEVQGPCLIKLDRRIRSMIIYGSKNVREEMKKKIEMKRELNQRYSNIWTLDLHQQPTGYIKHLTERYGVRLINLYEITEATYININFFHQRIEVYGSKDSLQTAKEVLQDHASELDNSKNVRRETERVECPICRDSLETTRYQLETCTHSYCKNCILLFCEFAIKNRLLPLQCAVNGCGKDISIQNILDLTDVEELIPAAVHRFVANNKDSYRYCITPDCMNAYKVSESSNPDPYECGVCQAFICTYCHVKYHDGVACNVNRRAEDEDLMSWLQSPEEDRGVCPNCSVLIVRIDGCNSVNCLMCKAHVCWRCKRLWFDSIRECYDHMALCNK